MYVCMYVYLEMENCSQWSQVHRETSAGSESWLSAAFAGIINDNKWIKMHQKHGLWRKKFKIFWWQADGNPI